jgi:hypothetical protein
MATPTSARFSAGASFTPSPVMATICPSACSAATSLSLCAGLTRANTLVLRAASRRRSGVNASMSSPVSTAEVLIPMTSATASAVPG